jgi:hypothetical protein
VPLLRLHTQGVAAVYLIRNIIPDFYFSFFSFFSFLFTSSTTA